MLSHGLKRSIAAALGPAEIGFEERMASLIYKDAPGAARCGIIRKLAITILDSAVHQSTSIAQSRLLEFSCSTCT